MGRFTLAFRVFFGTLFNRETANRVEAAFQLPALPERNIENTPISKQEKPVASKPKRSDALTLLEALQREARFLDLCHEALENYSDEQIGAAARNVIRDTSKVLQRYFDLHPSTQESEGDEITIDSGFDPLRYKLTGSITGQPPYRGKIVHTGWEARRCELPQWTGGSESAFIVAPAEVEVS